MATTNDVAQPAKQRRLNLPQDDELIQITHSFSVSVKHARRFAKDHGLVLVDILGRGNFGTVALARAVSEEKHLAVKLRNAADGTFELSLEVTPPPPSPPPPPPPPSPPLSPPPSPLTAAANTFTATVTIPDRDTP